LSKSDEKIATIRKICNCWVSHSVECQPTHACPDEWRDYPSI